MSFLDFDQDPFQALERTFFHDIQNTIAGLLGWCAMFERAEDIDPKEATRQIVSITNRLNRDLPDMVITSSTFGQALRQSNFTTGRQMEYGLKILF